MKLGAFGSIYLQETEKTLYDCTLMEILWRTTQGEPAFHFIETVNITLISTSHMTVAALNCTFQHVMYFYCGSLSAAFCCFVISNPSCRPMFLIVCFIQRHCIPLLLYSWHRRTIKESKPALWCHHPHRRRTELQTSRAESNWDAVVDKRQ